MIIETQTINEKGEEQSSLCEEKIDLQMDSPSRKRNQIKYFGKQSFIAWDKPWHDNYNVISGLLQSESENIFSFYPSTAIITDIIFCHRVGKTLLKTKNLDICFWILRVFFIAFLRW